MYTHKDAIYIKSMNTAIDYCLMDNEVKAIKAIIN